MEKLEKATLAGGCFWCTDAVFKNVKGVLAIKSGFTGGKIKNPAYREVVQGLTEHVEAIELLFDPQQISYRDILLIFFATHDPTSFDRQGYDAGSHYRSVVFYHNADQKITVEDVIDKLNKSTYDEKIVTQIKEASSFYEAELVHQDFYNQHTDVPYCQVVINPKLGKLRRLFADKLKKA